MIWKSPLFCWRIMNERWPRRLLWQVDWDTMTLVTVRRKGPLPGCPLPVQHRGFSPIGWKSLWHLHNYDLEISFWHLHVFFEGKKSRVHGVTPGASSNIPTVRAFHRNTGASTAHVRHQRVTFAGRWRPRVCSCRRFSAQQTPLKRGDAGHRPFGFQRDRVVSVHVRGADAVLVALFHLSAVPWRNEVLPYRKPVSH